MQDHALDFLAQGETVSVSYNVAISDESGAAALQSITITLTGANDAPVITGGDTTGSVSEDGSTQITGHLASSDPDNSAQQFWSVNGGSSGANADHHFRADSFSIVRNGISVFTDTFSDNNPPPSSPAGMTFANRLVGGPGTPPDQLGDDAIELSVRELQNGTVALRLRELDFVNDQITNFETRAFAPPAGADQIRLDLTHSTTDVGAIHASVDYFKGGVLVGSDSFATVGRIFGTETPGFTGDDEVWTRADIVASAPAHSDSILSGTFGTLNITQSGDWTYSLDNATATIPSLSEGQLETETFTVTVKDQFGAFDTKTITVDVAGTNDTPVLQTGAVSRTISEDGASATGLSQFSDVDLQDSHTVSASMRSDVLSNGNAVSAGLQTALQTALGAHMVDAATGDGHGEFEWDFLASNDVLQFLTQGESLTLHYDVAVNDLHGGSAMQDVAIVINGADDAPFVSSGAPSNDLTEKGSGVLGVATSVVKLTIGDADGTASYDITGWTQVDQSHWKHDGTYGSAVLDTSGNTLTYTLDDVNPATNALNTGDNVHDNVNVVVRESDGALTSSTAVSFAIHGTTDAPPGNLLVNFEDLPPSPGGYQPIPDGYKGLVWHVPGFYMDLYDLDSTGYPGTGYQSGSIAGGHVVAFTPGAAQPIDIHRTDNSDFTFNSVYLTSAWDSTQQVTLSGYNNGVLVGSQTLTISNQGPALAQENWGPINDLVIGNTGSQLVLDNFLFPI